MDHLVAARQSVGRERLVRHVTRTTYLPLLFLLLFSLMTITRPSLPLVRASISPSPSLLPSSFAFALVRALLTGDSSRSPRTARYSRAAGPDAAAAPRRLVLRVRFDHIRSRRENSAELRVGIQALLVTRSQARL